MFSVLFVILIIIGILIVFCSSFFMDASIAFLIYNSILLMLYIVDIFLTPNKNIFVVERNLEEKLSLGVYNDISIRIKNNSKYCFKMKIRDSVPEHFELSNDILRVKVTPWSKVECLYKVIPQKRGEFHFNDIYIKYHGILGLFVKSIKFEVDNTIKVYPNLKDIRKYSIQAIKKSNLHGMKKNISLGLGTEFESIREYVKGDDIRKINWMATARVDKLMVNTYQPEKDQHIFIMIDTSRVMNSEINNIKKLDYAINAAFLLAVIAINKGDKVGLIVFDSEIKRFVPPGKGIKHFQLLADNLYNVNENFVHADYQKVLSYLAVTHKRRSLLCVFTEVFNVEQAEYISKAFKGYAPGHKPCIFSISDPRIEQTANLYKKSTEDIYNSSAAIKLLDDRKKSKEIFSRTGIPYMESYPDKFSLNSVNKYFELKARGF